MTAPPALPPLPEHAVVLRALEAKPPFFASPAHVEPTGDAFKPNSADIAEGARRGLPVGISVFDDAKTTPAETVGIRRWYAERARKELQPVRVFRLSAADVRRVARAYTPTADVVDDPITEEGARELGGASGHAAIWGLFEPDSRLRRSPEYKAMLDRMVAASAQVYPAAGS